MTSRLRKKPPTTALTFLAKACSTSAIVVSFFVGVTADAQDTLRSHFREHERSTAWSATRTGAPQEPLARPARSRAGGSSAAMRTPAISPQEVATDRRESAGTQLNWRTPQLRSDEMPRRLPAATAPVGRVTPRGPDNRTATEKQQALIRLVSQIEEIEFPKAKKSDAVADTPLQLPLGRDALAVPDSSLLAAPTPDDVKFKRPKELGRTRPTAQQTPSTAEGLFSDEPVDEPDLGVLIFDDPPSAPVINETERGDQPQPPLGTSDDRWGSAEATEPDFQLPSMTEDATTNPIESLTDPPEGLGGPPDFASDAPQGLGVDDEMPAPIASSDLDLSQFKGRDCDAENTSCNTARDVLRRIDGSRIRVDITPSILPLEADMAKVQEARDEQLADVPSREWRDRQGNLLVEGTLSDFRDGRVYVTDQDGTVQALLPRKLSEADWCFVASWWNIPTECRFRDEAYVMRDFRLTTFTWTADATCHKPLYFEEVYLERSGHTAGPFVQPFVSGAHFFGNVAMLPYHMGLNPPNECRYTLGHYRPGECAPWFVGGFPMSTRGLKWQGLAWAAAIALLP